MVIHLQTNFIIRGPQNSHSLTKEERTTATSSHHQPRRSNSDWITATPTTTCTKSSRVQSPQGPPLPSSKERSNGPVLDNIKRSKQSQTKASDNTEHIGTHSNHVPTVLVETERSSQAAQWGTEKTPSRAAEPEEKATNRWTRRHHHWTEASTIQCTWRFTSKVSTENKRTIRSAGKGIDRFLSPSKDPRNHHHEK